MDQLWEADLEHFRRAAPQEVYPEPNKVMSLIDMCHDALKKHLRSLERIKGKDFDYEAIKTEVADWLAENEHAPKPIAKALEYPSGQGDDGEPDAELWDVDVDALDGQQIRALVKNKFRKASKGAGKAPGGPGNGPPDHSGKTCYDCGEPGHVGADRPPSGRPE